MRFNQINIHYHKQQIIESVDFRIHPGEIFVLMGPSGSGKSTLLKGIAGLLPLTSGSFDWEDKRGTMGLVFQEPRLFPHMTVLENIAFGLKARGIPRKKRLEEVREFLRVLKLEGLEERFPYELSGGQQQRVSLGRLLVLKPDLLLLDEPFASLDTPLRIELTEWLYNLQREQGFSILWVTHYIDEAFSVADRIGVLLDGKLQQVAKPSELFNRPKSESVAAFLNIPNRFPFSQWQKWFSVDLSAYAIDEMGWIPANAIILESASTTHHLTERTSKLVGRVVKITPGKEGYSLVVEVDGQRLDVAIAGWVKVPEKNDDIHIQIPFERICWYPE